MKMRIPMIRNTWRPGERRIALFLGALAAGMLFVAALSTPVRAQNAGDMPQRDVSINLQNGDIRSALDALFKGSGLNYTIDPSVTGTITISLRGVPFDVALRSILRAANPPLTYSVQDGVYQIKPRSNNYYPNTNPSNPSYNPSQPSETTPSTATAQAVRIPLLYADAAQLMTYAFGGGTVIPPLTQSMGTGSGGMGGMGGGMNMGGMSGMGGMGGGMN